MDWLKSLNELFFKNKIMRVIIIGFSAVGFIFFCLFGFVFFRSAISGNPTKIAGKEYYFNISKEESKPLDKKPATKKNAVENINIPILKNSITTPKSSNNNSTPKKETLKTPPLTPQPQFDLKGAKIDKSAIGINPKVEIYEGIKQREISEEYFNEIILKTPNKEAIIKFYLTNQDKESLQLSEQIREKLQKLGYKKFALGSTIDPSNITFDKIDINKVDEYFTIISIYPSGNVR